MKNNYNKIFNERPSKENPIEIDRSNQTQKLSGLTPALTIIDEHATLEPQPEKPLMATVANCSQLNLREKPSKSSSVLSILNCGDKLSIIQEESLVKDDEWMYVCTESDMKGYVMTAYIKEIE